MVFYPYLNQKDVNQSEQRDLMVFRGNLNHMTILFLFFSSSNVLNYQKYLEKNNVQNKTLPSPITFRSNSKLKRKFSVRSSNEKNAFILKIFSLNDRHNKILDDLKMTWLDDYSRIINQSINGW